MNFGILGLFTLNVYGYGGCIFLMVAHGVTSAALFFCIGVLYDRYHTRLLPYYSGIALTMPAFSTFLFYFFVSNIGFPGTANFISEFLIFLSLGFRNSFILVATLPSFLLSLLYCIFVFNKLCFGTLTYNIKSYLDLSHREFYVLFILFFISMFLGLFPQILINLLTFF
jgi:NADH-quinone oxidoreductase subunit M